MATTRAATCANIDNGCYPAGAQLAATQDNIVEVVITSSEDPDIAKCRDSYPDFFLLGVH